ncbi:MAG: hemerythrin domain-containing protein [Burkholderiaceae bacterium]|nr:hemerythrin domain-containing protein [Burkholderiaceae bacterium]
MGGATVSNGKSERRVTRDGFEVLDSCHRQMLTTLDTLAALVGRLEAQGADDAARAMAGEVLAFFSTTAREHHEDEERHVFPKALASADPEVVQAALRLQQDHDWIEEDWMELSAHLEALAAGQSWWDPALLREGSEVFIALLHDHVALEEGCIYPEARARMKLADRQTMGREMAARRRAHRAAG